MPTVSPPPLRPVVVGGDIGAYGSARAFHEAYGVRTVVLAGVSTGAVAHSVAVDHRVVADLDDDDVLVDDRPSRRGRAAGRAAPGPGQRRPRGPRPGQGAGQADRGHRRRRPLRRAAATMHAVTTKAGFSRLCEQLGVPHPRTRVLRVGSDPHRVEVTFPAVVKASSSAQFHASSSRASGRSRTSRTQRRAGALLDRMAAAGLRRRGGGPGAASPAGTRTWRRSTPSARPTASVRFLLFGQVLLEEATPNGLGNSVAQITGGRPGRRHRGGRARAAAARAHRLDWLRQPRPQAGPPRRALPVPRAQPACGPQRLRRHGCRVHVARMYGDALPGR